MFAGVHRESDRDESAIRKRVRHHKTRGGNGVYQETGFEIENFHAQRRRQRQQLLQQLLGRGMARTLVNNVEYVTVCN